MELLSQASRILYDKEILDFKKKQQETAEENKILHTPHVQYENQEEWKTHVNLFKETIKQFIFVYTNFLVAGVGFEPTTFRL